MAEYDTYVLTDFADLQEDVEIEGKDYRFKGPG